MQLFVSLLLAALSFGSPVHIHVQLAGNFGEPRPNHFHGGIDVKTERGVTALLHRCRQLWNAGNMHIIATMAMYISDPAKFP